VGQLRVRQYVVACTTTPLSLIGLKSRARCPWATAANSPRRLVPSTSLSSRCKRYVFHHANQPATGSDCFKASLKALKPGLHWDAVQLLCHRTLVRGFQKLGIFRSGTDEAALLASGVSAAFFPHGVGHSLGLDVHDVPSASKPTPNPTIAHDTADPDHETFYDYLRLRLPLEAGMVVVRIFSCCPLWSTLLLKAVTNMSRFRR
jgi:Metallopeptidase family M24